LSSFMLMLLFATISLLVYFAVIMLIARTEFLKTARFVLSSVRKH
jgi:CHASE3 domain sensor protein